MKGRDPGVAEVLEGIRAGRPVVGPRHVHVDVTNGCNAACVTCWDHSPLLHEGRPAAWKRQRVELATFRDLVAQLAAFGSVQGIVVSGMGEPATHPDLYPMLDLVKAQGWSVTLMTNLVAADAARIQADHVLVGVQGATMEGFLAFHPGWTEEHWYRLTAGLRTLQRRGVRTRHVHVVCRELAGELEAMVEMGATFGADRVNFKLASLAEGTERVAITEEQRGWMLAEGIPRAEAKAAQRGVPTNLALFRRQVEAGGAAQALVTTPMDEIGCYMGYVYTRITVEGDVLYCCNTNVKVGSLATARLADLWWGDRWQALRGQLAAKGWVRGCERCGKVEQNLAWSKLIRG